MIQNLSGIGFDYIKLLSYVQTINEPETKIKNQNLTEEAKVQFQFDPNIFLNNKLEKT